ncbi:histidine-type phosphatase [Pseudoduganella danionis]|uniref:Multiple inositol polyphosphate phosphatase 1 n=1 Tax=Pseudoduganella danionis TaxID=1890295 RepID=A0ABW9SPQ7_9BURK|nr:histidine-type phosphatase [Pseudoduganella danionis]MTW33589.1 histidine-type phosphatase [Pseudoduganella danionis]
MPAPRLARTGAAAAALSLLLSSAYGQHYQTKTPYQPQLASASSEAVPQGYRPIHTQLLARHGSRGLTSMKSDLALYNLVQLAKQQHALTPLGAQLEPAIYQMMEANALLGYGVAGIRKPGYGNETMQGIREHQQLAQRLYQRMAPLFQPADASSGAAPRQILLLSSGKDRAVDSGEYFAQALFALQPALQAHLVRPAPLAPRSSASIESSGGASTASNNASAAGTDRFLLYFHKLNPKTDLVSDSSDPLYAAYQASLAYQAWLRSEALSQRLAALEARPELAQAAHAVLARLFQPAFLRALGAGQHTAANTGSMQFTSKDGQYTSRLTGDGETALRTPVDAALALYELYAAAADMQAELRADFHRFMPQAQAAVFAAHEDAVSFYSKGPGLQENGALNYAMAQPLLDDFFEEVAAVAAGDLRHVAKLRFAHAEIVIPMAALLGLQGMSEQLTAATPYSYKSSPWRGERVAPMAANIQWDAYQNDQGQIAVRMLYNEQPVDFKTTCAYAKLTVASQFYDFARLRRCYQRPGE